MSDTPITESVQFKMAKLEREKLELKVKAMELVKLLDGWPYSHDVFVDDLNEKTSALRKVAAFDKPNTP